MIRIALYLAIAGDQQDKLVVETGWAAAKRRVNRGLDRLRWSVAPSRGTQHYFWSNHNNGNKGDHTIRVAIREQLTAAFPGRDVRFTELGWGELTPDTAAAIGQRHDLFVLAGSAFLIADAHGNVPERIHNEASALETMTCSKVAYGIGVNQNFTLGASGSSMRISSDAKPAIARVLASLDLVAVRDAATAHELQRLSPRPIHLIGDPALYYGTDRPRPARPDRARLRIGLNLAFHANALGPRLAHTLPVYAAFLRRLAANYPVDFHYIQHSDAERAIPLMLRSHGVPVLTHDLPASELPDLYRSLDLHLCEMLHSSISAIAAGVPTLNVGYDTKNPAFFEMLGIERFSLAADGLTEDNLWEAFQLLMSERDSFAAEVALRMAPLATARDKFLAAIATLVAPPRRPGPDTCDGIAPAGGTVAA